MAINDPGGQANPPHEEDYETAEGRKYITSVLRTAEENLPRIRRLFWWLLLALNLVVASLATWFLILPKVTAGLVSLLSSGR